jgi:hypothetical protein
LAVTNHLGNTGQPVRLAYQPGVLFSQNKPANSNQTAVLFSPNKSALAISHQPNEQAEQISSLAHCTI